MKKKGDEKKDRKNVEKKEKPKLRKKLVRRLKKVVHGGIKLGTLCFIEHYFDQYAIILQCLLGMII